MLGRCQQVEENRQGARCGLSQRAQVTARAPVLRRDLWGGGHLPCAFYNTKDRGAGKGVWRGPPGPEGTHLQGLPLGPAHTWRGQRPPTAGQGLQARKAPADTWWHTEPRWAHLTLLQVTYENPMGAGGAHIPQMRKLRQR